MGVYDYNKEAVANLKISDTSILDPLVDFQSARKAHLSKDHSQKDKRISLKEAVSEYVKDGDVWCDGSFGYVRTSLQSTFEIMRQKKTRLQAIGSPNTNQSYMVPCGTVNYVHMSYTGAEMRGTDRLSARSIKEGKVHVLSDWSHGSMALGFKAAQLGVPGLFTKSLLGSDILKYNPYVKVMQNPLRTDHDPVVYVPALYPDVTFLHVQQADKMGNARIYGPAVNDIAVAGAARKVIITAEEIVPESELRNNNKGVVIPFMCVDAVVELPYGGIPGSVPGYYYWSRQWWEQLMRYAATSEENYQKFFEHWVFSCKDQFDFLEKLGGARWIIESKRLTKAEEYDNEDEGFNFSYKEWTAKEPTDIYY